jgi:hypothetical protein
MSLRRLNIFGLMHSYLVPTIHNEEKLFQIQLSSLELDGVWWGCINVIKT